MALSDIVNVVITTQNPGITQAGFGIPLVTSHTATWAERTRTYNNIAGVVGDFAATTAEYQAANAFFAQSPSPPTIMIGRCANKPTQIFNIAIATVISVAGTNYKVRINDMSSGSAGAAAGVTATFTTVGADTNDSIATGIQGAITALAIAGVTATLSGSVGSKIVVVTMTLAKFIGIEVYDILAGGVGGLLSLSEVTADPGITADLTAINNESVAWYGLNTLFRSSAIIAAAAAWVETNTKLFLPATSDTLVATQALGVGSDVAQTLKASARFRTGVFFHPRNDEFADCAQMARFFPLNPGSENWRLKTLSGPSPANLTSTQVTNLNAKYCNFYYLLGGVNAIGGNGKVSANEYIDVIRFRDWWVAGVQGRLVNLELQANKIPYTDAGIALIEAEVRAQNTAGIAAGGISATAIPTGYTTPGPVVTVPLVANVSPSDKQNRVLNNVNTAWVLAGAINAMTINAQITH